MLHPVFIYRFHSNFKQRQISPSPHLKILCFSHFLLQCRTEYLFRKKWLRMAVLQLKVNHLVWQRQRFVFSILVYSGGGFCVHIAP